MIFKVQYDATADVAHNWNLNTKPNDLFPNKPYLRYQGKGQSFLTTQGKLSSQFWLAISYVLNR